MGTSNEVEKLEKTLKEGERILGPTRRPDGTLRKPVRIRAGYVPQDEVAVYQSKGSLWKKETAALQEFPPGYDPEMVAKPKSKSAKRNEKKREKRQQAAPENGKNPENGVSSAEASNNAPDHVESVASQMNELAISANSSTVNLPSISTESGTLEDRVQGIDKKIRALKKKIRLTESQQQKTAEKDMKPEQLEKVAKLESWHKELKQLEDERAEIAALAS